VLAAVLEEKKKLEIEKQIREKQLEFNLLMERQKKEKRSKK
jgi:hypothetical protein